MLITWDLLKKKNYEKDIVYKYVQIKIINNNKYVFQPYLYANDCREGESTIKFKLIHFKK